MKIPKRIVFYFLYFSMVSCSLLIFLEVFAASILQKKIKNSLSIFDCILCEEQNILKIRANYNAQWKDPDFTVLIRTNNRGYREDFDFKDKDIDIAFMGDSFTFGHGVNIENRYSNIVASNCPKLITVSLSYNNGFQPEHYEYFLDKHPGIKPKLLFIGLYLGNDLDTDLRETVIERNNDGKIQRMELPYRDVYNGVLINALKYRYSLSSVLLKSSFGKILMRRINSSRYRHLLVQEGEVVPNAENRLSTELGNLDKHNLRAIRSLKEIANISKKREVKLHILLIPQNFLVGNVMTPHIASFNNYTIDEIRSNNGLMKAVLNLCKIEGLNCHDLSTILTKDDYLENDAHWNDRGHEKVGNYVSKIVAADIIKNKGINQKTLEPSSFQ